CGLDLLPVLLGLLPVVLDLLLEVLQVVAGIVGPAVVQLALQTVRLVVHRLDVQLVGGGHVGGVVVEDLLPLRIRLLPLANVSADGRAAHGSSLTRWSWPLPRRCRCRSGRSCRRPSSGWSQCRRTRCWTCSARTPGWCAWRCTAPWSRTPRRSSPAPGAAGLRGPPCTRPLHPPRPRPPCAVSRC